MKGKCWHVNWPTQSMILERCTRWRFLDTLSSILPLDRGTRIDDLHLNTKAREVILCKASHLAPIPYADDGNVLPILGFSFSHLKMNTKLCSHEKGMIMSALL